MPHMRLLATLLIAALAASVYADYRWPEEVVTMEDMRALTPMRIDVPRLRQRGDVRGPVVLKVHVDKEGAVERAVLIESSGSSAHDEAAMHAMRAVTFSPTMRDGQAVDVTLIVPLHLPIPKYPSRP